MKKAKLLLKVLLVLACLGVLGWLYVTHDGIQYTLAFVTRSFGKPYFDPAAYSADANCDGAKPCSSGAIKVMTFNVLCNGCDKPEFDPWEKRLPHLIDRIEQYDPDLWGSQELVGNSDIETFLQAFPAYACVTYKLARWAYADCALFYRKDRFEVLDSGQMWLSPKPTVPLAAAWKPLSVPRYVNWVYLRQKENGFRFLYVNTHFDNNGPNKEPSAVVFSETYGALAKTLPIIATGDFNTDATTQRYKNLEGGTDGLPKLEDAMHLAQKKDVINTIPPDTKLEDRETFIDPAHLIDHIFVAGPIKKEVLRWVLDASTYGEQSRLPSDHPSVYAEIVLSL